MHARQLTPVRLALLAAVAASTLVACTDDGDWAASSPADGSTTTSAAAAESSTSDDTGADAAGGAPGLLYVQRATGGAAEAGTLRLSGVEADTVWFQDRPGRNAGRMTTGDFVDGWAAAGFAEDPPNATVEIVAGGATSDHVVVLSDPRWDAASFTLEYTVSDDAGGGDPLPATFDAASLFIDDASGQSFQPVTVQFSNVQPGQQLALSLTSNGTEVGWSTGPDFQNSSGLAVSSQGDVLPLMQMEVNPSQIRFTTSSASESGTLSFTVRLFLVGQPGIDTFYVRSDSDPGVEVELSVADSVPQVVDQSQTLFPWNAV